MKIGERVVLIEDYGFAKKGMTGIVIKPEYRIFAATFCDVEYDKPLNGGYDGFGRAWRKGGHSTPVCVLKLLENEQE